MDTFGRHKARFYININVQQLSSSAFFRCNNYQTDEDLLVDDFTARPVLTAIDIYIKGYIIAAPS
jgi:hypothetical protein